MADDVQLTDLEVIQQFSLAVRGASAPRAAVIAALEADLAYLKGERGRASATMGKATTTARPTATSPAKAPVKANVKAAPARAARSRKA